MRRVGGTLVWWFLPGLAVAAVAAYILGAVVWHANPPAVPVAGVSMRPTFQPGDLVLLAGVDPNRLHKGEIVAFNVPGDQRAKYNLPAHLVHRIIKIDHTADGLVFHTKGDANPGPDVFVIHSGDVVGHVVARLPGFGYPLLFFRSRQGEIFLGAVALVVAIYFLLGLFEERRAYVEGTAVTMQTVLAETEELRRTMERADRMQTWRPPPGELTAWPLPALAAPSSAAALDRLADEVRTSSLQSRESSETVQQLLLAVAEYGQHLRSHTAVMQGLAASTGELQRAAQELRTSLVGGVPSERPAPVEVVPAPRPSVIEATVRPAWAPLLRDVAPRRPSSLDRQSPRRRTPVAIDPTELRAPTLARSFRGYEPEAVDRLLGRAAGALDDLAADHEELRGRLDLVEGQLAQYRQLEASLSQAMVAAEHNARELRAQVEREAEVVLNEARVKAREIAQEALAERERLLADARGVRALLQAALGVFDEGQPRPTFDATPPADEWDGAQHEA